MNSITFEEPWQPHDGSEMYPQGVKADTQVKIKMMEGDTASGRAEAFTWGSSASEDRRITHYQVLTDAAPTYQNISTDDLMAMIGINRKREEDAKKVITEANIERAIMLRELNRRMQSLAGMGLDAVLKPTGAMKR